MAATQKETYLRLLGYVLPYRRTFGFAILAMVILAATEPAVPALMKPLLDGSFVDRRHTAGRGIRSARAHRFSKRYMFSLGCGKARHGPSHRDVRAPVVRTRSI